jgi:hypothetical protein
MRDGAHQPLLSSATLKVSNPRLSPEGRWLAFDATQPGGLPKIVVAPLQRDTPIQESEWIVLNESASHPFWSRDGCLLYYLATFPNIDIRSRVLARAFDTSTGRVDNEATDVLTLREMIVPAMVTVTWDADSAREVGAVIYWSDPARLPYGNGSPTVAARIPPVPP